MEPGREDTLALLATDIDAFYERLVLLYWHQLKAFVLSRTGNPQDAEDIVQETFIRVYIALERYSLQQRQTLKARPWLYKIAWNIYCNHASRSKVSLLTPLDLSEESDLLEREDIREDLPEIAFERVERRQELEALVATLPPHYRTIVSLYYFDDLTHQEIADILNQPVGTVKVYAHRGIRLLRKALTVEMNEVR